ncbi:NAD(P)H-binding protein [Actinomadura alba]|uniref:NAD(P)H-binding protein n=1 Tax=Actinomadura alba TaxID=406431 RepID=A0ABR7LUN6_9ACTN|nr:NAD(P)H-binding protein [Actinomadura alba]MBC6468559.1 NAD(P)H-binding protein [Actinomadura alba]
MAEIAVTGATGNLGRIVIEDLLTRVGPEDLIAIARTPGKAADLTERGLEVRHGDYGDAGSLDGALAGVRTLLLVSSPDLTPGVRVVQHRAVIDAAARAGVRRLVYTSGIGAGDGLDFGADHSATEQALEKSGLTRTVLRNALYSEAFLGTALAQASRTGEVTSATEGQRLSTARLRDLALAASAALTGDGHENATYDLYGPLWTYAELAETLSGVLGKPVAHREVTDAEAGWLGALFPLVRSGALTRTGGDLERLLGRPPAGLHETVTALIERQARSK